MDAAPERFWNVLDSLVPRRSARDSALHARINLTIARSRRQPRIPLTVHLDPAGGIRADTTLGVDGRALRVTVQRIDTLSMRRPF